MSLNDLDKSAEQLVKTYRDAYEYILERLEYQIENGLSERQSISLLREIQQELQRLDTTSYEWAFSILPEYYYTALDDLDLNANRLKGIQSFSTTQPSLSQLHRNAIEVAANDLYNDLARNTAYMSEQSKQIIRGNSKEIIDRMVISGESQRTVKRDLKNALRRDGVTSFVDAAGKHWKIDHYASMAVRSKSRIIHNTGTMNRLQEYREEYADNENFDLIRISSHGSTCWCGEYEGTVWSISGNHPNYPSIEQLPNRPYNTLHPNCRHVFVPHMPELKGRGKTVSNQYLNRTIKDLNKELYHKQK